VSIGELAHDFLIDAFKSLVVARATVLQVFLSVGYSELTGRSVKMDE
jgi:hypothetical protein